MVVTAEGSLRNNSETPLSAIGKDEKKQAIGEEFLGLDPKRIDALLRVPPIASHDAVVVCVKLIRELHLPLFFPIPPRLHLLEIIRADLILLLFPVFTKLLLGYIMTERIVIRRR